MPDDFTPDPPPGRCRDRSSCNTRHRRTGQV